MSSFFTEAGRLPRGFGRPPFPDSKQSYRTLDFLSSDGPTIDNGAKTELDLGHGNERHITMTGRLTGRVAVITGGASGIGRATALRFLDEGALVVVGDLNEKAGAELSGQLADRAERFRFVTADISAEGEVAGLVETALSAWGSLDIMFNNAGIGGAFGPITDIEVDHWDLSFAVLVRSVFLGTKHAARAMIAQGGGTIINTASVAGLAGGSGPQAYSAAKAAVVNLTLTTATELAPHRIRVNAICPGVIFTPLATGKDESVLEHAVAELQPWPDRGEPDDIAAAVTWLASDDARFVTGEAIRVDGGLIAAGTRMGGLMDPHGAMTRYAGFGYGTTGKGTTKTHVGRDAAS
jgi:NAD(P)-dependent dehydrogenase (short-subunit alcohol dehydrogenase family)